MQQHDSASWLLELMEILDSPEVELARDVLEHMAQLRVDHEETSVAVSPPPKPDEAVPRPLVNGADVGKSLELQSRREALYRRLRGQWLRVASLPCCLKQSQLLRETAALASHSQLLLDPLAEAPDTPLTLPAARSSAERAVACAQEIGDTAELVEACLVLGRHCMLTADFDAARRCGQRAAELSRQIRSLRLEATSYRLLESIMTLTAPTGAAREELTRRQTEVFERMGDSEQLAYALLGLAKIQVLGNRLEPAGEVLAKAAATIDTIPVLDDGPLTREHAVGAYHRCCTMLRQAEGRTAEAAAQLRLAIVGSSGHEKYRAYGLIADLAQLEDLYRSRRDEAAFATFCHELTGRFDFPMRQWHLPPATPPTPAGTATEVFPTPELGPRWRWIDPLSKGACHVDGVVQLTPATGTGFLSNVCAPRLVQGGSTTTLRIARQGSRLRAWCSDGDGWFGCGEADLDLRPDVQVGLFAECTYRDSVSLMRCTTSPTHYTQVRLYETGSP